MNLGRSNRLRSNDKYEHFLTIVGMALNTGLIIYTLVSTSQLDFWGHITIWATLSVALTQIFQLITTGCKESRTVNRMSNIMYEISWTMAFFTTFGFWIMVAPSLVASIIQYWDEIEVNMGGFFFFTFINFIFHSIPSIAILLDLRHKVVDFYWVDFFYPFMIACIYFGVNLVLTFNYYPMYPYLTYTNVVSYVMVVSSYLLLALGFWLGKWYESTTPSYNMPPIYMVCPSTLHYSLNYHSQTAPPTIICLPAK